MLAKEIKNGDRVKCGYRYYGTVVEANKLDSNGKPSGYHDIELDVPQKRNVRINGKYETREITRVSYMSRDIKYKVNENNERIETPDFRRRQQQAARKELEKRERVDCLEETMNWLKLLGISSRNRMVSTPPKNAKSPHAKGGPRASAIIIHEPDSIKALHDLIETVADTRLKELLL